MTKATIQPGVCGFTTVLLAETCGDTLVFSWESACPNLQKLAGTLPPFDPIAELFSRNLADTQLFGLLAKALPHAACPLYAAFFKIMEAEAGMALPRDVSICFEKEA